MFKPGETAPLLTHRTGADGRFAIHLAPCAATLRVYRLDGALVAVVHSSAESGFYVDLPVGRYVVEPRSTGAASFDHAAPFSISIARGAWRSVTIMVDTGIR